MATVAVQSSANPRPADTPPAPPTHPPPKSRPSPRPALLTRRIERRAKVRPERTRPLPAPLQQHPRPRPSKRSTRAARDLGPQTFRPPRAGPFFIQRVHLSRPLIPGPAEASPLPPSAAATPGTSLSPPQRKVGASRDRSASGL
jgi:hypothetical protein